MEEDIKSVYHRYFGEKLIKCDTWNKKDNDFDYFDTADVLKKESIIIGVYFSFANVCDHFTKSLVDLYERINGTCDNGKKLEVIQIVLWTNNVVAKSDKCGIEQEFGNYVVDMPWFAVPFAEIDKKNRLSLKYGIKTGMPSLVLLDSDCTTITSLAYDRLMEDPTGERFPWRPRPVDQVLRDVRLQQGGFWEIAHDAEFIGSNDDNKEGVQYSSLNNTITGFYFSAHWCPPCKAFTPQLVNTYQQIRKRGHKFEIIFVSSDRSEDSFNIYTETMPWLTVPYEKSEVRRELATLFGVQGIPSLVLQDANGHIITTDGRAEVIDDPDGLNFPWKPKPVNILTERYATKMHDYPAIVLFIEGEDTELQFAESVLTPIAENYYKQHKVTFSELELDEHANCENNQQCLQFLIGIDSDTSDILREFVGLDDVIPMLTALNIPERKYAFLEYGVEINSDSVKDFIERFIKGTLEMRDIRLHDKLPTCDK